MERNVCSFRVAICKGYEPKLYSYHNIPLGAFEAILDFKTWSKRIIAINCYFTKFGSNEKFVVTVYCNNKSGKYEVTNSSVDFLVSPLAVKYKIWIALNQKQKIKLVNAAISN